MEENRGHSGRAWLARFGLVGFLFFFFKGLAWLIVPVVVFYGCRPTES